MSFEGFQGLFDSFPRVSRVVRRFSKGFKECSNVFAKGFKAFKGFSNVLQGFQGFLGLQWFLGFQGFFLRCQLREMIVHPSC